MRDVAKRAGVAPSTVSRALRNHPGIPIATRRRIVKAASALGYRPNPLVATLMAQRHTGRAASEAPALAVLDFSLEHPPTWSTNAFPQFEAGARARAHELGFDLASFWCNEPDMNPARLQQSLLTRGITGVIVPPVTHHGGQAMDLDWSRFTLAGLASMRDEPQINRAGTDHYFNVQLALKNLTALGYHKIGFTMPRSMSELTNDRWLAGFYAFHHNSKNGPQHRAVYLPEVVTTSGLRQWLETFSPDAIVYMGGEIPFLLNELKIRVPEQLGVATLNRTFSETFFTGVSENSDAVGAATVDLLVAQIHRNERGLPANPYTIQVRGHWCSGQSTHNRIQVNP
jgi:DNA-binding LacI/PurR family transcriptional regulator